MIFRGGIEGALAGALCLALAVGCQSDDPGVVTEGQEQEPQQEAAGAAGAAGRFDRSGLVPEPYLPTQIRSATASELLERSTLVARARFSGRRLDVLVTEPEGEDISGASDVYDGLDFDVLEVLKGDSPATVTVLVPTLVLDGDGNPVVLRSYGAQDIPADLVGREFLIFLAEFQGEHAFMGEDGVALIEDGTVVDTFYAPSDPQDPLMSFFGMEVESAMTELAEAAPG